MQKLAINDTSGGSQPIVLSTVPLPLQPLDHATGSVTGASTSAVPKDARYGHVLGPRAINPHKDLVALISRDVDALATGAGAAADPHAGLPPPPPGMSAAAAQALMRMRMIARAKALAQQKAAGGSALADAPASSAASTPKLVQGPTLRLSLWRMASIAGQVGERVWDTAIKMPDLFDDLPDPEAKEIEDVSVDAITWHPDGQVLALAVRIARRRQESTAYRENRFVALHALQDGKRIHQVLLPNIVENTSVRRPNVSDMQWVELRDVKSHTSSGSAAHVLSLLEPLPSIAPRKPDDKEQKARQKQRMMQRLRDPRRVQANDEKTADEVMLTDPRGKGKALLTYPHLPPAQTWGSSLVKEAEKDDNGTESASILQISDGTRLHYLLDASVYLGSTQLSAGGEALSFVSSFYDGRMMTIAASGVDDGTSLQYTLLPSAVSLADRSTRALMLLRDLSASSYSILVYMHDALVAIKGAYRTLHGDTIADWNRRAKRIGKQYGTTLKRELMTFIMTGFPSEAAMTALLGSDAPSEKDLKNLASGFVSGVERIETLINSLKQATRRLVLVYDEIRGCQRWPEHFGAFLDTNAYENPEAGTTMSTDIALATLANMTMQYQSILRMLRKEVEAYRDFYTWWSYERIRQEAYRDDKPAPEPPEGYAYNVVVLSEFIQRGFDNAELEALIDVRLDARTRGTEIDDDDDDEDDNKEEETGTQVDGKKKDRTSSVMSPSGDRSISGFPYVDARPSSNTSPWYDDELLRNAVAQSKRDLSSPPDRIPQDIRVRQVPTTEDVRRATAVPTMYDGPFEGFTRRQDLSAVRLRATRSLPDQLDAILDTMAAVLRDAFSRWMHRKESSGKIVSPRVFTEKSGGDALVPLREEGITSQGTKSRVLVETAWQPGPRMIQMRYAKRNNNCLATYVVKKEGMLVLRIDRFPLEQGQTQACAHIVLGSESDITIKDLSFYTSQELIILMHLGMTPDVAVTGTSPTTMLISIHLDDVAFQATPTAEAAATLPSIKPIRSAILGPDDVGAGATMLACNRRKDVCATLDAGSLSPANASGAPSGSAADDDSCQLVYWDMVLLSGADEDERGEEKNVDKDHEMNS